GAAGDQRPRRRRRLERTPVAQPMLGRQGAPARPVSREEQPSRPPLRQGLRTRAAGQAPRRRRSHWICRL
ncbi:MAG: hypothetical protein AVDCRST_MAG75-3135, partial [uncultured Propionibacteriaceae bacterium]